MKAKYPHSAPPPSLPYVDTTAMESIKQFVRKYMNYSEQEKEYISDDNDFNRHLTHDICNSPIRTEKTKKQQSIWH